MKSAPCSTRTPSSPRKYRMSSNSAAKCNSAHSARSILRKRTRVVLDRVVARPQPEARKAERLELLQHLRVNVCAHSRAPCLQRDQPCQTRELLRRRRKAGSAHGIACAGKLSVSSTACCELRNSMRIFQTLLSTLKLESPPAAPLESVFASTALPSPLSRAAAASAICSNQALKS